MALQVVIDLDDAEEKAFNLIVLDAETWIRDAVRGKLVKCGKRAMRLLKEYPDALTLQQKTQLQSTLDAAGVPFGSPVEQWPLNIIKQVVVAMDIPTRAERDAAE
jgi:hypothetical protein